MDLTKLSTARKLELMKSYVKDHRPKSGMKAAFHPSEKRKQAFLLMNPGRASMPKTPDLISEDYVKSMRTSSQPKL